MPVYTSIPNDAFVAAVHILATAIRDGGWAPDHLIGIGRGGLVPAVYLSHALGLPTLSVDYSSQVEAFAAAPLARLAERTCDGARLLFVDDINDTGGTIAQIRATLAAAGAVPERVRFATLIDNVRSAERVDYAARTIDREQTKDWFVFPWEAVAPAQAIAADAAAVPERTA
ncbi:phosphoribosyltransferase [Sphingomonas sp. CV7422]|uniref:phosphoribosyltransferase n=1 Tax=Sphingomonas sp. CV7422 TaxID=3018036 RepID=UPI0022FDD914|nr:phosphoribosyltransferase domain-containing protein [Sphingomonas sp. CV7422]